MTERRRQDEASCQLLSILFDVLFRDEDRERERETIRQALCVTVKSAARFIVYLKSGEIIGPSAEE